MDSVCSMHATKGLLLVMNDFPKSWLTLGDVRLPCALEEKLIARKPTT